MNLPTITHIVLLLTAGKKVRELTGRELRECFSVIIHWAKGRRKNMAFAISRNQLIAGVIVSASVFGLASTTATHAASTSMAHGTASVKVVAGDRTLDKVAGQGTNLDFGEVSLNDLTKGAVNKTAQLPAGTFQVTDNSGAANGWVMRAAVTNFKGTGSTPLSFDGALTLNNKKLIADDQQGTAVTIYQSTKAGVWTSEDTTAAITVPSTAVVDSYKADISYTLDNGQPNN